MMALVRFASRPQAIRGFFSRWKSPVHTIRVLIDTPPAELSRDFDKRDAPYGRPSIPLELRRQCFLRRIGVRCNRQGCGLAAAKLIALR